MSRRISKTTVLHDEGRPIDMEPVSKFMTVDIPGTINESKIDPFHGVVLVPHPSNDPNDPLVIFNAGRETVLARS